MKIEIDLKNLILKDYADKNSANIAALTQSEVKDIILGMEMTEDSIKNKAIEDIERQQAEQAKKIQTVTTTTNIHGEQIAATTLSNYE